MDLQGIGADPLELLKSKQCPSSSQQRPLCKNVQGVMDSLFSLTSPLLKKASLTGLSPGSPEKQILAITS